MKRVACIEDLRRLAASRVPRTFYEMVDTGSYAETTYRANEADFQSIKFRQRVGVNVDARDVRTTMLGQDVAMPLALAPTGLAGMQYADGEIHAARAAEKFGVPFTLSTMSVCSIEDVRAATNKPFWFQLYVMRDRAFVERLIERAQQAHCSALFLTMDLAVVGQRHHQVRNPSTDYNRTLANLMDLLTKPRWCARMLGTRRRSCGNVLGHAKGVTDHASLTKWVGAQFDPRVTWDDVEWIKKRWNGPLVLKGLMDSEDARHAVNAGADAIIVSNHGGRQLDGAESSVAALPAIVDAVGKDIEVWMDGGVRGGQDILKARALGARATLIGRSFLYGLGAGGEQGVTKCLQILKRELDVSMGFCGQTDINAVTRDILVPGTW